MVHLQLFLCIWSKPRESGSPEPRREHGAISDLFYVLKEISSHMQPIVQDHNLLTMYVLILRVLSVICSFFFFSAHLTKQDLCNCISLQDSEASPLPTRKSELVKQLTSQI